jgi:hypothetical protein
MDLKSLGKAAAEKAVEGMAAKTGRIPDDVYTCTLVGAVCVQGEGKAALGKDANGQLTGVLSFSTQWLVTSGEKTGDKLGKAKKVLALPDPFQRNLALMDDDGALLNVGRNAGLIERIASWMDPAQAEKLLLLTSGESDRPESNPAIYEDGCFAYFERVAKNLLKAKVTAKIQASTRGQYQNLRILFRRDEEDLIEQPEQGPADDVEEAAQENKVSFDVGPAGESNGEYEEGQAILVKRGSAWKPGVFMRYKEDGQITVRLDDKPKGVLVLSSADEIKAIEV